MKVLIIGSGAREHAIGVKLLESPQVEQLYFAPGNGGTAKIGENIAIEASDQQGLLDFAEKMSVDYTIVGPEDPLVGGIVDRFEEAGRAIFGPRAAAAHLEGSKTYAKEFCRRHNLPAASSVETDDEDTIRGTAEQFLSEQGRVVLKADGLAAGKGVIIASTMAEVEAFIQDVDGHKFPSRDVVVEEYLEGFEMSLIAFTDGKTIRPLASAKDHKTIFEGGKGPNTGGMGTYSPNLEGDVFQERIQRDVLDPFLKALREDELDFRGIVFIGLMLSSQGVKILEFNVRFGDPETQSILQRLDGDLLEIMMATSAGKLSEVDFSEKDNAVVSVVLASGGYPASSEKGVVITGVEAAEALEGVTVYHAGTKWAGDQLVTNGGRVLTVTGEGESFQEAVARAYAGAALIEFERRQIREDIGPKVHRVYVKRKAGFNGEEELLAQEIREELGLTVASTDIYYRYDLENIGVLEVEKLAKELLSEAPSDELYLGTDALELQGKMEHPLVVEYQPGQYVQRQAGVEDGAVALLGHDRLLSRTATVYDFHGPLGASDLRAIREKLVNPVDQKVGLLFGVPTTLKESFRRSTENPIYDEFTSYNEEELRDLLEGLGLAMSLEDLKFIQSHYQKLGRDINETELAILDTYWSDHCRHTTFNTELMVNFEEDLNDEILAAWEHYQALRREVARKKPVSLMDLGTIVAKALKKRGVKTEVEESEEINACSIHITVEATDPATGAGEEIPYLLMFKNETHNHPTEIEPFGGASTCLGGCIRDPLSGRAYVYQAMRITGAADPRTPYEETLEGKLPQKKITTEAAKGYSSYGNQIGLAAGLIHELYHPGYVAKRMEIGAVVGANRLENVVREVPAPGDLILLLGGRTGRDGIGGATGSSKEHNDESLKTASAEVQKGNAPMERKLVRLFRNPEVSKRIKRCNDFGAGGVSVAIGELADGVKIHLDRVPLKYEGLTPKEIAISESQERMAVVIDAKDLDFFRRACREENLEWTQVAEVTEEPEMLMLYEEEEIARISREFIDTSGVSRSQEVILEKLPKTHYFTGSKDRGVEELEERIQGLNVISQKNLIERFDSSVGAGTVLQPLGGKHQLTPTQAMVAAVPVEGKISKTVSAMSFGGDPKLLSLNPFQGGYYAVVESVAKLVATGANPRELYATYQEYFESLREDPRRWALPLYALLGAMEAAEGLAVPPIGGKDSMSGSFQNLNVPPTLISFSVAPMALDQVIHNVFDGRGKIGYIAAPRGENELLDLAAYGKLLEKIHGAITQGKITTAIAVNNKGPAINLVESLLGNDLNARVELENLYDAAYGDFLVAFDESAELDFVKTVGEFADETVLNGKVLDMARLKELYLHGLDGIFSGEFGENQKALDVAPMEVAPRKHPAKVAKVVIPAFPGTNSEVDTKEAFEFAGAEAKILVFKNQNPQETLASIEELAAAVKEADILAIPGGFSFSDEPDGSAKFIAGVLRTDAMKEAVEELLDREGLVLGICNGFQALVKSGYLPFGEARPQEEGAPTLTFNDNHRHVARLVKTRVTAQGSPWLQGIKAGDEYLVPISHGEGRLVVDDQTAEELAQNGQIATVYVDNPNGSSYNIEGLLSRDGHILGKMGHVERVREGLYRNVPGVELLPIIQSGVDYICGKGE
ncbi:MAG: phosphoribosylformylglycinamidine synthase [Tissierellia bacterium]|nr:phosphoribosylformylglycinamidine synthase [Tissierellia bacterium]